MIRRVRACECDYVYTWFIYTCPIYSIDIKGQFIKMMFSILKTFVAASLSSAIAKVCHCLNRLISFSPLPFDLIDVDLIESKVKCKTSPLQIGCDVFLAN